MDASRIVPQLFFDLIARVAPGIVAFILWACLWPDCDWTCILNKVAGGNLDKNNVFAFAFFVPLGAGYIVGHLIAPIGKWLCIATDRAPVDLPWQQYDWLRVHRSDAGALAAKIRAEYTMHFSLAAAFLLGLLLSLYGLWPPASARASWLQPVALLALLSLSLYRGHETVKTFSTSVNQLYSVAQERVRPVDPPWSDEQPPNKPQ